MLIVPNDCRRSTTSSYGWSWGKGRHTIGPSEGQSAMGWGKAPCVIRLGLREGRQCACGWVWGRMSTRIWWEVGSVGIISDDEQQRVGTGRNAILKRCYLLAFMHIVSGVFSGCNSHTIASSMEADVQRFSPVWAFEWPHALLGELCKEWFLDALDFYTFSILFLCSARADTTHFTLQS